MNFSVRSRQTELLDDPNIPFEDIRRNMEELDLINRWLGGHSITISGLAAILKNNPAKRHSVSVCEIGCGGGDNLVAIRNWCRKKNIDVSLTGIDINPNCIEFAQSRPQTAGINFITSDYRQACFEKKPDIIFSSLFCHHFNDTSLAEMMTWMKERSELGFFINDLHRHRMAYYSIKLLTQAFSKSYLVRNDAPISVTRGFTRSDFEKIMQHASVKSYTIEWKWAFRWLVTVSKFSNLQ